MGRCEGYVAARGGTQARSKRWLVFIVLLTADISSNFVCEIPNLWIPLFHIYKRGNTLKRLHVKVLSLVYLHNKVYTVSEQDKQSSMCLLVFTIVIMGRLEFMWTWQKGWNIHASGKFIVNNHSALTLNCPQTLNLWTRWDTVHSRNPTFIWQMWKQYSENSVMWRGASAFNETLWMIKFSILTCGAVCYTMSPILLLRSQTSQHDRLKYNRKQTSVQSFSLWQRKTQSEAVM